MKILVVGGAESPRQSRRRLTLRRWSHEQQEVQPFFPEVRERAVRMVQEDRGEYPSLWACIESIAPKIGCVPQTLNDWVKQQEIDTGLREGLSTEERSHKVPEARGQGTAPSQRDPQAGQRVFRPSGARPPTDLPPSGVPVIKHKSVVQG